MKAKIGAKLLASLPGRDKPYEINDSELRGFQLRVLPSGTKTFYCVYRLRDGSRKNRYAIGRTTPLTTAQARDEARKILGDIAQGIDPNRVLQERRREQATPTLLQFIEDHYASWAEAHLAASRSAVARIKAAFSRLLGTRLDELTAWQLDKWKSQRLKAGTKASTVNRDLGALRSALTKAVEWEFVAEHPMSKVREAKGDQDHRVRYLTPDEETRLRAALAAREAAARQTRDNYRRWQAERRLESAPRIDAESFVDHLSPMVLISINTGLRRGEVFHLRRSDIDFPTSQLKVRAASAKSGKSRFVPLNSDALEVVNRWLRQHPGEASARHDAQTIPPALTTRRGPKEEPEYEMLVRHLYAFWHSMVVSDCSHCRVPARSGELLAEVVRWGPV